MSVENIFDYFTRTDKLLKHNVFSILKSEISTDFEIPTAFEISTDIFP